MKKDHIHMYKRAGMTLYCTCGLTQSIACAHRWNEPLKDTIKFDTMGGTITQSREMRICKICGGVMHTNRTTGVSSITH